MSKAMPARERDAITYVEFSLSDRSHPVVSASRGGGRAVLEALIPRGESAYAEYFTIVGVEPDDVVAHLDDYESVDVRVLLRHGKGGLFEFVVNERCPAVFLCLAGAIPREVESIDGQGRVSVEVHPPVDPESIVGRFLSTFSDAELAIKRRQPYTTPRFSNRDSPNPGESLMTDRQREVLVAAYDGGFYDWPRGTTGEELAESIGISPSTLHQHLRAAERYLIESYMQNLARRERDEVDRRTLLEQ